MTAAIDVDPDGRLRRAENFPVASRLLPATHRADLLALYRFARTVDEIGDSLPGDRLAALEEVDADLDRLAGGATPRLSYVAGMAAPVAAHGVPVQLLRDLVQANRVDQTITRYPDMDALYGYCRLSANPVGRIVLHLFDAATPQRLVASDQVCTALQLLEHWQDVAEDARAGRVYLPIEDLDRFQVGVEELTASSASPRLRALLEMQTDRAAALLDAGASLTGSLRGAARLAVAGFVAGGQATVHALRTAGYDVLATQVRPHRGRLLTGWARLLRGGQA